MGFFKGLKENDSAESNFMENNFVAENMEAAEKPSEEETLEEDAIHMMTDEYQYEEDEQMFYEDDQMVNTLEEAEDEALYGAGEEGTDDGLYEEELPEEEYPLEEEYPEEDYPAAEEFSEEGYEEEYEPNEADYEALAEEGYEEEDLLAEEKEAARNDVTVITKGTIINGSIVSDGSLEINGQVNGDIECLGKLTILGNVTGDTSASEVYVNAPRMQGGIKSKGSVKVGVGTVVIGDISGTSSVIAGAVKGNIDVAGPVIVDSTAVIKGDIKARAVQVNNGAVLEGFYSLGYSEVDIDSFFEGEE